MKLKEIIDVLDVNVDDEKLSDKEFRKFCRILIKGCTINEEKCGQCGSTDRVEYNDKCDTKYLCYECRQINRNFVTQYEIMSRLW